MPGLGTIINMVLVFVGSIVGLFLKKSIPQRLKDTIIQALGLATFAIGILGIVTSACKANSEGILSSEYSIVMVLSLAIGSFIGELFNIDKKLENLGASLQNKFEHGDNSTFSEGFVTASLVFCVGSMAILGSLNDGIRCDPTVLITKGLLDCIMSIVFASTLGIGVMFSIFTVGIYQGLITVGAFVLEPVLTDVVIMQMSFVGSILIMGIGLNFLYKPSLKLSNMLPSMFIPLIWYILKMLLGGLF